ncbi:FkbM family methyltransferase [Cyanobium sp. AMD-g]|uniref:FkbM family methyltransferase n=1 Tax=Cyanobium sp. AMD-g TaxID=2823699 RepID=UPI0020CF1FBE|nr:FkbM family methyltransferase [Cyanobium sp. AMD-g]
MRPKPSPYPLIRIGGKGDGAYLVPDDLQGIKACFSPGVNNTKDFEDDLTDNHGIPCHMCDFTCDIETMKTPLREGLQTFRKKWLDVDGGSDSITIDEWVEGEESAHNEDLLLQMDIEGAEFRNLLTCSEATINRFRIILVELHGLSVANDPSRFEEELGPLLRKLDKTHICVHAHPNNCDGEFVLEGSSLAIPHFIELTFLRRDRFLQKPNGRLYPPMLPHPLDIDCNVEGNAPLFLDGDWLDEESLSSMPIQELSTWKKVSLLAQKLEHSRQRIQYLESENKWLDSRQKSAGNRIDYLEQRFAELERPIRLYLAIKHLMKRSYQRFRYKPTGSTES